MNMSKITKEEIAALEKRVETQNRLNEPYERALGKLSIRFSLLHSILEQFGWDLWGMDAHAASILTKDLPTKQLVKKLRDSVRLVNCKEEDRKQFLSILTRVEKVADKRNEFLHSIWIIKEGQPILCFSRKRGELVGPDAPSSEDIGDLSRSIMNIVAEFIAFKDGVPLISLIGRGLGLEKKR